MKTLKTMVLGAVTLGMLTFNSCKKEVDPIADPTACFTISGDLETGESIIFSNCSRDAAEYLWYFGDGTSSESADPTHVYYNSGTYTVELNSYNEEGISKSTSKTITIADKVPVNMIINSITVASWPQTNNGVAWDNNSYPDMYITVSRSSNILHTSYNYYEDCSPSYFYDFGSNSGFPLTIGSLDNEYSIVIYDRDVLTSDDWMGGISFRPSTQHVSGQNSISLEVGEFSFLLDVSWVY